MHEHWSPQLSRKNDDLETRLAGHPWYEEMVVAYFMTFQRSPWSADQNDGEKLVCQVKCLNTYLQHASTQILSLSQWSAWRLQDTPLRRIAENAILSYI